MSIRLTGYASYSRLNWILSCSSTFNLKKKPRWEISWLWSLRGEKFPNELTDRSKKKKMLYMFESSTGPAGLISNSFVTLFQPVIKFAYELIHELTANRYASIYARIVARVFRACCFSCSPLRIYEHLMCAAKKKKEKKIRWRFGVSDSKATHLAKHWIFLCFLLFKFIPRYELFKLRFYWLLNIFSKYFQSQYFVSLVIFKFYAYVK